MINIIEAQFLISCSSRENILPEETIEVAFLGRSNVGKSSIINALTNRKQLAKSSSTPGKTRLINFFKIVYKKNDEKYFTKFVDLPGFGYAKVSKKEKEEWKKNLTYFVENRRSIRLFVHLVDSRHFNLDIDAQVEEYLKNIARADQEILKIFTKADKLNQKMKSVLKKQFPTSVLVSVNQNDSISSLNNIIFNKLFGE